MGGISSAPYISFSEFFNVNFAENIFISFFLSNNVVYFRTNFVIRTAKQHLNPNICPRALIMLIFLSLKS